jgi:hypothetical protein
MSDNDHIVWGKVEASGSSDSQIGSSDDPPSLGGELQFVEKRRSRNSLSGQANQVLEGVALLDESASSSSTKEQLQIDEIDEKYAIEGSRQLNVERGVLKRPPTDRFVDSERPASLQKEPEDQSDEEDEIIDSEELTEIASEEGEEETLQEPPQYSKGSKLHDIGRCKPCHYVISRSGCFNGADCSFCHLSHPRKSRPRPCKTKREQCKRIVDMLEEVADNDPEQVQEAVNALGNRSSYLNRMLKKRMRKRNITTLAPSKKASSSTSSRSLH